MPRTPSVHAQAMQVAGERLTDPDQYRRTESEASLQAAIVEALRWSGYVVEVTSERRKRCETCGTFSRRGSGVTRGIPDLLVGVAGSPLRLGLEVKNARGVLSLEQKGALAEGRIIVVRSVDEALAAAREWRLRMEGD